MFLLQSKKEEKILKTLLKEMETDIINNIKNLEDRIETFKNDDSSYIIQQLDLADNKQDQLQSELKSLSLQLAEIAKRQNPMEYEIIKEITNLMGKEKINNEKAFKVLAEAEQENLALLINKLSSNKEDIGNNMEQLLDEEKKNYMNLALLITNNKSKEEALLTLLHQQTIRTINDN
jgi:hypothetical protein